MLPLANVASNDDLGVPPESREGRVELWERKCATEDRGMLRALVRIGGGPAGADPMITGTGLVSKLLRPVISSLCWVWYLS